MNQTTSNAKVDDADPAPPAAPRHPGRRARTGRAGPRSAVRDPPSQRSLGTPSLENALVAGCALALLLAAAAWCWGLLLALAEVAGGGLARGAAALPCPALVRGLALGCLGVGLAVVPAAADPPHDVTGVAAGERTLTGLGLPERQTTGTAPTVAEHHGGRPLRRHPLGDGRPGAPRRHAGCRDRPRRGDGSRRPTPTSTDPHLIFPGTVLRVPPLHDLHRKDRP